MYSRLIKPPREKSFFLFGPRGTGKTTWVKATFPRAIYLDLLEAELFNDLLANPQRLEALIPKDFSDWIVIDEIQRIPDLLHEVHRLIERNGYKFVLTGSSARKLRRKGPDLLAGRALTYRMHPLTAVELGENFNLDHSLRYGHLPCAYTESDPKRYLESYVMTYLEEEVRQEGLIRNLGAFARFLEAASFSQSAVLNVSAVARECAVERKVVENYFTILEDLLLAYRLPVFTKRAKRRMAVHRKFYFFDVGVYRTLRPAGPLDLPGEIEGAACETLLFQELLAINDALNLGYKIYYWRTSNNIEVDFVLYGEKGLKAFEIKRTSRVSKPMLRGLRAFLRDYPMAKAYYIYGGKRYMREGDIEIIPIEEIFKQLPVILSSPADGGPTRV
ncbi:ATP-binding protein [candidate division WOR-3 bacterium]|mgnify:CR=1 FL=1|uniref:ATP-binding protein n=1 Tax=candidate division WOR-3 bacterium TaxID=2052148 RepID=A0A660SIT8_UNCW3|nr:MAG: ATP-binding protein [candidate division WOR-3 bacterium]